MKRSKETLPGYSLIFVIFIFAVLTMILAALVAIHYQNQMQVKAWIGKAEAECNANSAITLMRDQHYTMPIGTPIVISLFNGLNDSVTISRGHWGLFTLLKALTMFKNTGFYKIALCGDYHHDEKGPALIMGSNLNPLCICGSTFLKGNIKVPGAGIKAATVNGLFYQRKDLVLGKTEAKDRPLPQINPRFLKIQPESLVVNLPPFSRLIQLKDGTITDSIVNGFKEPTIIIHMKGVVKLKQCKIIGNIMIISDSLIEIESSAFISDAIICSKNIIIQPKFRGTGQFIATDTLICGHSCTFPSPSILAVICTGMKTTPLIFIDKMCLIEGTVLAWSANPIKPLLSIGHVHKKSCIVGSLLTNCNISLNGEVFGNVIAQGFIFKNTSAIYQNFLVNATIDYSRQPQYFIGIAYDNSNCKLNVIKWLQ